MPLYESGEDITAYLTRFVTVARLSKWPKEIWPTRLALLFSGVTLRALLFSGVTLNVYSTLPEEVCKDYDALKAAVLKAFRKTPEQYRREFRYAKFKQENFMQYLTNLYRLFDFWVDSAKIQKTYEGLRDFIVTDQFLSAIPKYIRLFLMEQGTTDDKEMAEKADLYCGAHDNYPSKSQTKGNKGLLIKTVRLMKKKVLAHLQMIASHK